jgi:hypothetical protein
VIRGDAIAARSLLLPEVEDVENVFAIGNARKRRVENPARYLATMVSGGGNYHDRAKARSKPTQEPRENVAVPFQSIGSRGSPVSTLIVRPMTSLGTVGGSSWTTARTS